MLVHSAQMKFTFKRLDLPIDENEHFIATANPVLAHYFAENTAVSFEHSDRWTADAMGLEG